ncbi:MAG: hydrogenase maturation protease [Planctomycetes bacterium]|nr:hydrogenase maturation protease [Planctomycetota bacterium]
MKKPRILVAGVGNIFFGDDAFGVEVAARLVDRPLPPEVRVHDFGIRGFDLAYAMTDGFEVVILVDAVPRGGPPGSLYLIEPEFDGEAAAASLDAHSMDPVKVLRFARSLGGPLPRVLLVGCEPTPPPEDEMQMGLSEPVHAAVDEAADLIEWLVARLLTDGDETLTKLTNMAGPLHAP